MPTVYLNHIYATLSDATFSAITQSEYLTLSFAELKVITTRASASLAWTGCYLYGQQTYIELFSEQHRNEIAKMGLGNAGVGFGVDKTADIDELASAYQQAFHDENSKPKTLPRVLSSEEQVPWLYYIQTKEFEEKQPEFTSWVMAYHPEYLQVRDNIHIPANQAITRSEYNRVNYQNKMFRDIQSVAFSIGPIGLSRLLKEVSLFDYKITKSPTLVECEGPDIKIILHLVTEEKSTLMAIEFSLNQTYPNKKINIGDTVLDIHGKTATWKFTQ